MSIPSSYVHRYKSVSMEWAVVTSRGHGVNGSLWALAATRIPQIGWWGGPWSLMYSPLVKCHLEEVARIWINHRKVHSEWTILHLHHLWWSRESKRTLELQGCADCLSGLPAWFFCKCWSQKLGQLMDDPRCTQINMRGGGERQGGCHSIGVLCCEAAKRFFSFLFFFVFFGGGDLWCLAGGMRINDGCIVYVRQTCWVCSNPTERAKKSRGALTSPGNSSPCWGSAFSSSSSRHRWPGVWNRSLKCLLEVVFFSTEVSFSAHSV